MSSTVPDLPALHYHGDSGAAAPARMRADAPRWPRRRVDPASLYLQITALREAEPAAA